jgi:SagB-type dehydrogenase family enzyme
MQLGALMPALHLSLSLMLLMSTSASYAASSITLPEPRLQSRYSVEEALQNRRSVRQFSSVPVSLRDLGQLLWAAQGITSERGFRTAPSAGALYPLEIHVLAGNVDGLSTGTYRYQPEHHALEGLRNDDQRRALAAAAAQQTWVSEAAVVLVFSSVSRRTESKYGRRSERYILIEVGHAAQNVFLQAQSLALATAVIGAFRDNEVAELLELPRGERPIYLMPLGHPRTEQ